MPEVEIIIAERKFQVYCQTGEESFLRAAAAMLDAEATPLMQQMGRLPESRMLLMAGLMLADRTAGLEDEVARLTARLAEAENREPPEPVQIEVPVEIEVPVIPPQVGESLADIARRTEALAQDLETRLGTAAQ